MTPLKVGFLRRILAGAVVMCAATFAVAQSGSEYTPLVAAGGYTGFKAENVPGGTAVVGVAGVATIRTKHDGLALQKVKLFVPPGAMRLGISLTTYAVDQDARAAAKFGTPPASSYEDVLPETAVSDTRPSLKRLLAGDELKFYSPARSGVLMMANSENTDTFVGSAGGYIYFNLLSIPGNQILSISTRLEVNESCYSNWYANASWDQSGNPVEGASHTCSGSTGGNTGGNTGGGSTNSGAFSFSPAELVLGTAETATILPNPVTASLAACSSTSPYISVVGRQIYLSALGRYLRVATPVVVTCGNDSKTLNILPATTGAVTLTGISLSANVLIVGGSTASVTVQPSPLNAVLPQCTVDATGNLSITGNTVSLKSSAGSLTSAKDEVVTCGTFNKTITVKPAGSIASVVPEVITAADGKITLRLTLNQPAADLAATGVTTSVWIGAHLPAGAVFFNQDIWFFKTPTVWREIDGVDINALAFAKNQPASTKQIFDVPLGLTAADLRPFGIEIYFGYANSNGTFVNLGKVW
ncbi:MAG: hypothetical protein HUU13_00310 [Burkholderiaceae bacterium]|nr:hypothetical protein [Burkholderiaceae bacterium]